MRDNTGLSLGYRIGWRLEYIGVSCFGPAQHMPQTDPKRRLRRERAQRIIDAHAARGTQAPQWVHDVLASGGDVPRKRGKQAVAREAASREAQNTATENTTADA